MAGVDDVDVHADRKPQPVAGPRHPRVDELRARRLLPRVIGVGPQRGEVLFLQPRVEPERRRLLADELERGALLPRHAGDAHERRQVVDERPWVERHGVESTAARSSGGTAAAAWALRTALVSARA